MLCNFLTVLKLKIERQIREEDVIGSESIQVALAKIFDVKI